MFGYFAKSFMQAVGNTLCSSVFFGDCSDTTKTLPPQKFWGQYQKWIGCSALRLLVLMGCWWGKLNAHSVLLSYSRGSSVSDISLVSPWLQKLPLNGSAVHFGRQRLWCMAWIVLTTRVRLCCWNPKMKKIKSCWTNTMLLASLVEPFLFIKKPLIPSNSYGFCFQLTFLPCPECRYRRSLLRSSAMVRAMMNLPLMPVMALVERLRMVVWVMNRTMSLWWRISMPFPKVMYLAKLEVLDNI